MLYTSDHGDYNAEHGLFCKGIPAFNGAYHVPAVMRWPNGIANPGRTSDALVSLADFAPTFTDVATGEADANLTGDSLTPFLRDEPPEGWREAICTQCDGVEIYATQRAVWTADWKYVFNSFDDDELYDRRNDPHEMTNLIHDPQHDDVIKSLSQHLWRFAHQENDASHIGYVTYGFAPYGPAAAFWE